MWLAVIAAAFVLGLAVSWERWGSAVIDCGREMNQPLRLAAGERLYSDVRHIYGPFSPYFHALLFRLFGPSLWVLYADGIASAIVILALVYWLSRRIMSPFAAGAATLSVTWLCALKPAGNYVMPYSFGALHGTVFALASLALVTKTLDVSDPGTRVLARFATAGVVAGLAALAKTELGLAAVAAGIAAALLSAPDRRARWLRLGAFFAPALALVLVVYGWLVASLGAAAVVTDSWLLWYTVPPALRGYNEAISGFDHPFKSLTRMTIALAKLASLAAILAAASQLRARGLAATPRPHRSWTGRLLLTSAARALIVAALIPAALVATVGFDSDKGPYMAMPFLLAGLIASQRPRLRETESAETQATARVIILFGVFALVCLGRMILHVRSGGAYASFLVPVSIVLFTYLWAVPFGDWLESGGASRVGATIAVAMMLLDVVATAGILAYQYRVRYQIPVASERGTLIAEPDVGLAWNEALEFIQSHTTPSDFVAVFPEGSSLNFMSERRNPLREEITTPGYLDGPHEGRAIRQLEASAAPLVLITDRNTKEFGGFTAFGHDYATGMMRFIESRYQLCAVFGPRKDPGMQIGDRPFFIRAYCLKTKPPASPGGPRS